MNEEANYFEQLLDLNNVPFYKREKFRRIMKNVHNAAVRKCAAENKRLEGEVKRLREGQCDVAAMLNHHDSLVSLLKRANDHLRAIHSVAILKMVGVEEREELAKGLEGLRLLRSKIDNELKSLGHE